MPYNPDTFRRDFHSYFAPLLELKAGIDLALYQNAAHPNLTQNLISDKNHALDYTGKRVPVMPTGIGSDMNIFRAEDDRDLLPDGQIQAGSADELAQSCPYRDTSALVLLSLHRTINEVCFADKTGNKSVERIKVNFARTAFLQNLTVTHHGNAVCVK